MTDARALKDKAAQLFTKGKFAKAAETYEEFCSLDKKDHQARLRCGDAWAKAGKKDKAITSYSAARDVPRPRHFGRCRGLREGRLSPARDRREQVGARDRSLAQGRAEDAR